MQLSARCVISRFTAVALCVGLLSACATESRITVEAVDVYSCGTLKNNAANVDNFRDRMLSIAGYTSGVRFTDGLVWTTDFTDPEVVAGGDDSSNFDRSGDVIAYFSGHGTCDDQSNTACTSTARCPDVAGVEKRCLRFTDNPLAGRCVRVLASADHCRRQDRQSLPER